MFEYLRLFAVVFYNFKPRQLTNSISEKCCIFGHDKVVSFRISSRALFVNLTEIAALKPLKPKYAYIVQYNAFAEEGTNRFARFCSISLLVGIRKEYNVGYSSYPL